MFVDCHRGRDREKQGFRLGWRPASCSAYRNTINMILLSQPYDPDPLADLGDHEFRLALYPHKGDWVAGDVVRRVYEFNNPLIAALAIAHKGKLPESHSFMECPPNVIVTAMKKSEDSSDIVIRFYEFAGKASEAVITFDRLVASAVEMDNREWRKLAK